MPSASRSVRFTRTIFALMLTCGWRRSSDSAKATRSSSVLVGAVMLTLFVTSSNDTLPRPRHAAASTMALIIWFAGLLGLAGALDCAGGAPATGGWPAAALLLVGPPAEDCSDGMHCNMRVRT